MNCNLECSTCPYRSLELEQEKSGKKIIDVVLVGIGGKLDTEALGFEKSPVKIVTYKGYSIRILNFAEENKHLGRKILQASPDIVVNLVDSTDLENSLDLAVRLIDINTRSILAFCAYDSLLSSEHDIDYKTLGSLFGFPATVLDKSQKSERELLDLIVETFRELPEQVRHIHVPYGHDVDKAIDKLTEVISSSDELAPYHDRYLAIRLLEDPQYIYSAIMGCTKGQILIDLASKLRDSLQNTLNESPSVLISKGRQAFIRGALQETMTHSGDSSDHTLIQKTDSVLTSKWLGFPILIAVLFGIFEATFTLGAYPQMWIEDGISLICGALGSAMSGAPVWLSSLLVDGVLQGVGAVLAFLPNIIILFFFLTMLEDTGYMARAAFLMDKIMHRFGLHGRSFIPMLIGFGCNVPAIMATRNIEDRKERTLTVLMIPFMSCSARIPVYLLFVSAFFPSHKALMMISIYLAGVILSILFALVMKRTRWFRSSGEDYVSELPAFRKPTLRSAASHIWERVADYLKKISTVILAASVIIWALEFFPSDKTLNGSCKEESVLADIGKAMEPVMSPLGFDWKMNVCLLTGLPAKEAIVSTMGILYHAQNDSDSGIVEAIHKEGQIDNGTALAFMLFVLLYFPCIATIATIRRETSGKWAAFSVVHSLLLAYVVALVVNLIF